MSFHMCSECFLHFNAHKTWVWVWPGPVRSELGLLPRALRSLPGYPKRRRTQPMSLHTAVYRKCRTRARGQGQWDGVETGNTDLPDSPATQTTRRGVAVRKARLPQRYCCCHRSQLSLILQ